jgi:hypothetical protein
MLAVRTQAIDGARTCTLLDSQHCRLLPFLIHYADRLWLRPFVCFGYAFHKITITAKVRFANSHFREAR